MCDECSAAWWRALDSRPPAPPITLMTCGGADARWMLERDLRRADEHAERIRAYQEQIKRTCAEQHGNG